MATRGRKTPKERNIVAPALALNVEEEMQRGNVLTTAFSVVKTQ